MIKLAINIAAPNPLWGSFMPRDRSKRCMSWEIGSKIRGGEGGMTSQWKQQRWRSMGFYYRFREAATHIG